MVTGVGTAGLREVLSLTMFNAQGQIFLPAIFPKPGCTVHIVHQTSKVLVRIRLVPCAC